MISPAHGDHILLLPRGLSWVETDNFSYHHHHPNSESTKLKNDLSITLVGGGPQSRLFIVDIGHHSYDSISREYLPQMGIRTKKEGKILYDIVVVEPPPTWLITPAMGLPL